MIWLTKVYQVWRIPEKVRNTNDVGLWSQMGGAFLDSASHKRSEKEYQDESACGAAVKPKILKMRLTTPVLTPTKKGGPSAALFFILCHSNLT